MSQPLHRSLKFSNKDKVNGRGGRAAFGPGKPAEGNPSHAPQPEHGAWLPPFHTRPDPILKD